MVCKAYRGHKVFREYRALKEIRVTRAILGLQGPKVTQELQVHKDQKATLEIPDHKEPQVHKVRRALPELRGQLVLKAAQDLRDHKAHRGHNL